MKNFGKGTIFKQTINGKDQYVLNQANGINFEISINKNIKCIVYDGEQYFDKERYVDESEVIFKC